MSKLPSYDEAMKEPFRGRRQQLKGCAICGERTEIAIQVRMSYLAEDSGKQASPTSSRGINLCLDHGTEEFLRMAERVDELRALREARDAGTHGS